MKSGDVLERLGAYVDGELSAAEREAVEALLRDDEAYLDAVRTFRWLDDLARQETVPPVSGEEWARLWEFVQERKDRPAASRREPTVESPAGKRRVVVSRRFVYRLAVAAALLLLALLGAQMMWAPDGNDGASEITKEEPQATAPLREGEERGPTGSDEEAAIGQLGGELRDKIEGGEN